MIDLPIFFPGRFRFFLFFFSLESDKNIHIVLRDLFKIINVYIIII